MPYSREIRTRASEVKFLVSPDVAARIRQWARAGLDRDPNGSGPHGDEYRTTSVYFDTRSYDVFYRRGSYARSKYRIRRYGDDDAVFLERKLRQPPVLAKRRTCTALASLAKLSAGVVDCGWAGSWFHRRLLARGLVPVCQVAYQRVARVAVNDGELIRLTIDSELRSLPSTSMDFPRERGIAITGDHHIVEMKFGGAAPAIFKHMVEEFALNPHLSSKFRLGLSALGWTSYA
jgi:hypothetical protein